MTDAEQRMITLRSWLREGLVQEQIYIIRHPKADYVSDHMMHDCYYRCGKYTFREQRRPGTDISEETFAKLAMCVLGTAKAA